MKSQYNEVILVAIRKVSWKGDRHTESEKFAIWISEREKTLMLVQDTELLQELEANGRLNWGKNKFCKVSKRQELNRD